jgi:hypothetical protein
MLAFRKRIRFKMEEQIPPSQQPDFPQISPEQLEEMKRIARERAMQKTLAEKAASQQPQQIVYVRRNLTVAELALVVLLACGLVTGVQFSWNIATNVLPRIEIRMK